MGSGVERPSIASIIEPDRERHVIEREMLSGTTKGRIEREWAATGEMTQSEHRGEMIGPPTERL